GDAAGGTASCGPGVWREYRAVASLVAIPLLLELALIMGLLFERRARQRAELDSRRALALAADDDRRAALSALTGTIAHDLSQPPSAILHNTQAAAMLLAANRATPHALKESLADIPAEDARAVEIIQRHRTLSGEASASSRTIAGDVLHQGSAAARGAAY